MHTGTNAHWGVEWWMGLSNARICILLRCTETFIWGGKTWRKKTKMEKFRLLASCKYSLEKLTECFVRIQIFYGTIKYKTPDAVLEQLRLCGASGPWFMLEESICKLMLASREAQRRGTRDHASRHILWTVLPQVLHKEIQGPADLNNQLTNKSSKGMSKKVSKSQSNSNDLFQELWYWLGNIQLLHLITEGCWLRVTVVSCRDGDFENSNVQIAEGKRMPSQRGPRWQTL